VRFATLIYLCRRLSLPQIPFSRFTGMLNKPVTGLVQECPPDGGHSAKTKHRFYDILFSRHSLLPL
jgi:hypothetical protein